MPIACASGLSTLMGLTLVAGLARADEPAANAGSIADRYRPQAKRIIDAVLAGNDAYEKLEQLCDGIGHRLSGSKSLERAIEWAVATLEKEGQENVRAEPVMVPKWVRGNESATLIKPYRRDLPMLGLGGSVGTPPQGITAPVVSVFDEKELEKLGDAVRGKIVLFDHPMATYDPERGSGYGGAVRFRSNGARWAAQHGAVAALVRSVTARSLQSPHTGAMRYRDAKVKIPAAAITTEHAAMITRLQKRGVEVVVTLKMEARDEGMAPSANVVAELRGREEPDEIVVISGHFDSWDVGQGAHDDGGSCVVAMEVLNVLRKLELVPRRTIRVVLWTNEENGLRGARQYVEDHKDELSKHVAAIEMDSGVFAPRGYSVQINDEKKQELAGKQLADILTLLEPLGATRARTGHSGADVGQMVSAGVPCLGHQVEGSLYFDYHHSHADTIDKIDPKELDRNVAAMAVTAYVLADMPGKLGESTEQ
ncbi:MAG: M20/M25/M40 family metallo-hydrolase [Planctomycetes bacterium]|nr:M20/M25/M40 family metallo-hydrolase [Planctomycetota bacterium]